MARAPYLRHSGHLNQPAPSSTISREAEKDRIPTGAPTHVPGAPNPSLKGTLVSCCCSLTRLHSEAWKNSARTNPAQQIRGVSPRLRSQAISPVLTEEAELKQGCRTRAAALVTAQMRLCLLSRDWVG